MTIPFPNKKYGVIYCDPPWTYGRVTHNNGVSTGGAATHYPVMTRDELIDLPVKSIAEKNCCLFMWASGPKLDEAIELGVSWGFKYKSVAFVWNKVRCMPGNYTVSQCEYVIVFTRGSIPKPRGTRNERQYLEERRTNRHSEKPHEIRNRIERMFPSEDHNKIELFARHSAEGWDHWGNEEDLSVVENNNLNNLPETES